MKEGPSSPAPSPLLHRAKVTPRAVQRTAPDAVDGDAKLSLPDPPPSPVPQQQPGKVIIRAAKSPERSVSPDYVRTPATVVGPTSRAQSAAALRQGAYVNVQGADGSEGKTATGRLRNGRPSPNGTGSTTPKSRAAKQHQLEVRCVDSENKPPSRARHPMALRFRHNKPNGSLERRVLKPSARQDLYPQSLRAKGNTPKLTRRLPLPDPPPDPAAESPKENGQVVGVLPATPEADPNASPRVERKLKRSESYRMANSPIMFIKKLGGAGGSPDRRIHRTASEELREELLKERINYPESVASPEPEQVDSGIVTSAEDSPVHSGAGGSGGAAAKMPHSPRPRATDLEPARVLKYSGADTEIW